jgi:hypothetical protein
MPWVFMSTLEGKQNVIASSVSNYALRVVSDKFRKYLNFQQTRPGFRFVRLATPNRFNWTFVFIIEKRPPP